jgi:hypothetical protein
MEKNREVAVEMRRKRPVPAERRGGKAAGELSERVSVSDADSRVLRDDGIRRLQGSAQVEQQSRVTTGQEVRASPHGQRASQDASAVSSDDELSAEGKLRRAETHRGNLAASLGATIGTSVLEVRVKRR